MRNRDQNLAWTGSTEGSRIEKLIVIQQVKKFLAFYETQKLVTCSKNPELAEYRDRDILSHFNPVKTEASFL